MFERDDYESGGRILANGSWPEDKSGVFERLSSLREKVDHIAAKLDTISTTVTKLEVKANIMWAAVGAGAGVVVTALVSLLISFIK